METLGDDLLIEFLAHLPWGRRLGFREILPAEFLARHGETTLALWQPHAGECLWCARPSGSPATFLCRTCGERAHLVATRVWAGTEYMIGMNQLRKRDRCSVPQDVAFPPVDLERMLETFHESGDFSILEEAPGVLDHLRPWLWVSTPERYEAWLGGEYYPALYRDDMRRLEWTERAMDKLPDVSVRVVLDRKKHMAVANVHLQERVTQTQYVYDLAHDYLDHLSRMVSDPRQLDAFAPNPHQNIYSTLDVLDTYLDAFAVLLEVDRKLYAAFGPSARKKQTKLDWVYRAATKKQDMGELHAFMEKVRQAAILLEH